MFNGYNETPLISYNEYNQERLEKKQENVAKWSYGHDGGVQPVQNTRHSEFWPGRGNFLGVGNVVKCNCAGCYPSSENQSYQGDSTRHRPWLPRTFPVPLNGSNESCKLPTYQWDPNQGGCYPENNFPYVQENGGKYPPYYRAYQPNQPGVITSVKDANKGKNEMTSRGQESPIQNGALCNLGYNLTKRNYCDPNEKHSNVASYSVDQHLVRLPVVEPFIKAVPSNLSQNRVPSTGYRSAKDNMGQSYIDQGYAAPRKITETGDKTYQHPTGIHVDYSHLQEAEPQKLFFDNGDYYSRNNIQEVIKRNNQNLDNRKDCAMSMSEQHYNVSRSAGKSPYEAFFDKRSENPACFQRNENVKNENMNVHARLPRSALLFNDPRTQNPYQSNPNAYRNYLRPEYPYQGLNSQDRYEYPGGFQRNEINEIRVPSQQNCEQFPPSQQIPGILYEQSVCQQNTTDKMQQFYLGKEPVQTDSIDNRKPDYLESIRSEEINKNGTSKISPLRLLRKKKFINVPQEPAPVSTNIDTPPGLDVRKFWSTWADEEEENVAPTQMVVLDCQNIDAEQAKLLHLYETDPVRTVHLETGNIVIKNVKESTSLSEEVQQTSETETKETNPEEDKEKNKNENESPFVPELESKNIEPKTLKKSKSGKKKTEVMDKWTEKKFDFLKRAEESKAAEILRHEEEKKKIIETRLTLQQSLKKTQEKISDENSQSGTEEGNADGSTLPTCEYRRNKFLDYSESNVIVNGKDKSELEDEVKKEESIKNPTDMLLNVKLKEETGLEMEDILQKMSEINFENSEIKLEDDKTIRKNKTLKKKKTDQLEADKLTVETVTKPTIKFSIQKSHDLKISFKVLNSKEEGGEDPRDKGSDVEDSKNSTEFTLRYKTFQRDNDRRGNSGLKKKQFRKKKRIPEMKTPVLKIKKSRFMQQEEKDPLAGDDDDDDDDDGEGKTFADGYSNSDGFQVQETVDSAKIKLTFKRRKGNFETEYKINGNAENVEEDEENPENLPEKDDSEEAVNEEKPTGIETSQNCPEEATDGKSDTPTQKPEENSINSTTPVKESNYEMKSTLPISSDSPFEISEENILEETVKPDSNEKPGQEQTMTDVNHVINRDEDSRLVSSPDSKEEIEEISSDFIKSTNSPEIETNHKPKGEIENPTIEINHGLENPSGIKLEEFKMEEKPKIVETSLLDLISEDGVVDVEEMKITENSCMNDSVIEQVEDLIKDDFLPEREEPKPEIPPEDIPTQLGLDQIESNLDEENSDIRTILVTIPKEAPRSVIDFSILNETVPNVEITKCDNDQLIDFLTTEIDEPELEDGEIIDSSDEGDKNTTKIDFIDRKITRRHSISSRRKESGSWSRKKFLKAKSCPPEMTFLENSEISVENIPLPNGPPPLESCFYLKKYKTDTEAKEKPKESIFGEPDQKESTFGVNDLEKCRNPSPLGILQRNSKIKFSISKKSKFSKLTYPNAEFVDTPEVVESGKKECQTEEVPNGLENVDLLCEDLEQNVDTMTDLIGNEFYECEDIPTSEDLTNGDDLESEKVNDDKFRNIMQNCLDNAKKFLNVGNLKLFSCSVDDLLEMEPFEDSESEKPTNVRDVLLTSCGDPEDMGLSENIQPDDISDDFVPPFCSDICPEILPVDNWPYLEEEVISSPNKTKQDETDIIPALDDFVDKPGRKRVISEPFRRASDDDFRISTKVAQRRKTIDGITAATYKQNLQNESLKCRLSLKKLSDKHGIDLEFKNKKNQNGVLKKSKSLDYKSPSWQPKVMLFRISKNKLRKFLKTKREDGGGKAEIPPQNVTEPVVKKQKSEPEIENTHVKPEEGSNNVDRKRKKSRFRNLHTKRKSETPQKEFVDPEIVLTEIFNGKKDEGKKDYKDKKDEERRKDRHKDSRKYSRHEKSRSEGRHDKDDKKRRHPHWVCEVCGFDEPNERVGHIKSHPFHCQSCYLAFKTESHFISHLTKKHKDIRNQHHCLLCELSFDTEEQYQCHLDTREHKHLESVEKNTINTLFTLLTGAPCPVLGLVEAKPEWLPNQAGTVHFYHQATPLSLALQYLKMHRDLSSFSTTSSSHPT